MPNRDDSNQLVGTIERIDDSEPFHSVLPQPFEFPFKGLTKAGIEACCSDRSLDPSFDIRWEMANNIGNVGGDVELMDGRHLRLFLVGWSASPNTPSNERPFLPAA
jgi:hypothetical protein